MRPLKKMVGKRVKAIIDSETRETKDGFLIYNSDYECFMLGCGQVIVDIVSVYETT